MNSVLWFRMPIGPTVKFFIPTQNQEDVEKCKKDAEDKDMELIWFSEKSGVTTLVFRK